MPDSLVLVALEQPRVQRSIPNGEADLRVPTDPSPVVVPVVPIVLGAMTVASAYQVIKICVPMFVDDVILRGQIDFRTKERCAWEAASAVAGQISGAKLVPAVKVVPLRNALHKAFLGIFTHNDLTRAFNRSNKPSLQEAARLVTSIFYDRLYAQIKQCILNHR